MFKAAPRQTKVNEVPGSRSGVHNLGFTGPLSE